MNFGIAKMFGATDKKFQDRYNYLVEILSSYASNLASDISLLIRKDGGALYPFTAMPYVGTAPIIESGSNANGYYVKYADGTMICYAKVLSANNSTTGTAYTTPVTFYDTNISITTGGVGIASGGTVGAYIIESAVNSASSYQIKILVISVGALNGAVDNTPCNVILIGRWKA